MELVILMIVKTKSQCALPIWKRWVSYIYPLTIAQAAHPYPLKLSLDKGSFRLDSINANQSNGDLRVAFHQLFLNQKIYNKSYPKIALLGYGMGSVYELLRDRCTLYQTDAYESNTAVVDWVQTYLNHEEVNLHSQSAEVISPSVYDMIIVDLFEDTAMPDFVYTLGFWQRLIEMLSPQGVLIWNTFIKQDALIDIRIKAHFTNCFVILDSNRFYIHRNTKASES